MGKAAFDRGPATPRGAVRFARVGALRFFDAADLFLGDVLGLIACLAAFGIGAYPPTSRLAA
jgi:hypothetical protein